jgi:hypothetical protein
MVQFALALLVAAAPAEKAATAVPPAEKAVNLEVKGLPDKTSFTVAELQALGSETVEWTMHDQKRSAVGISLDKVLTKAGFSSGPMGKDVSKKEKRSGWKRALIATASDGFQAVFSCAELFPEMGPTHAVVAWTVDGKPQEPLRLVVSTDKEPSRSIYKLKSLEVVDLGAK